MAMFAWVRSLSIWAPPNLEPQILHDKGLAEYKILQHNLKVARWYELKENEEQDGLDALIMRYPPPGAEEKDVVITKMKTQE